MAKQINVEKLRKRLKLSQAGLADRLGVHQSTVARIEGRKSAPSKPVLKLLEQIAAEHA